MYIRRHFYDLDTGKTLLSYHMEGDILLIPIQQDVELYGLDNWGLMEWTEKDLDIHNKFLTATSVKVDVTKTPNEIIFEYPVD